MKISYNGQEIEAYSLVMTKENALAYFKWQKRKKHRNTYA